MTLTACAETKMVATAAKEMTPDGNSSAQVGSYKIGKPYQIDGTWYYPNEDYTYLEEGMASWYGPNFHGKMTANGETYDQMDLTAAHRTLPMPSLVRVTNLENGRSLVVRVNDRGPFAKSRIIDVSKRSAELLGFHSQGTARVRVEVLADESRALKAQAIANSGDMPTITAAPREPVAVEPLDAPPQAVAVPQQAAVQIQPAPVPAAAQSSPAPVSPAPITQAAISTGGTYIQAGAFSDISNAQRLQSQLQGVGTVTISPVQVNGQQLYRVRLGPMSDSDSNRVLSTLQAQGLTGARVVLD
jgi:rare lipoprotein A